MWPFSRRNQPAPQLAAPTDIQRVQANVAQWPHGRVSSADFALAAEERAILESPNIPISPANLDLAWGLGPTRSGVQINERTAMSYVAVFAATRVLAEAIGMLPAKVFEGSEDDKDHVVAQGHPLAGLLRYQPNPEMSAAVFKETLQGHLCLWGNAYARIMFNNRGEASQLWPLAPDETKAERFAGQLRYTTKGGRFAPEEIIHIPGLGFNGLQGLSPVGMARETIALGKAAELFGAGFFGNGAHVGGMLKYPGKLTPEQKTSIRDSVTQMHAGVGNVSKLLLVDQGIEYVRTGIPPEDAQFLQTREFQVRDIARLFRVPPHMLGDMEKASYNSIEQMSLEFLMYSLTPWLTKWEQELTRKLFGIDSGYFVRFDTRHLLRADHAAKQSYYASGRQWGYLSANDIRADESLPPIPGGDTYLQPTNMVPADSPMASGERPPAPAAPTASGKPAEPPAKEGDADNARAADVAYLDGVFEDAFARMLRKEQNALKRSNGNPKPEFYQRHAEDVRESLKPAATALVALLGCNDADGVVATTLRLAAETRHAPDADTATTAAAEARNLMGTLIEACKQRGHDGN
jgi:HK97 family phage portal protein